VSPTLPTSRPRSFVIDTDTGSDDAVALVIAVRSGIPIRAVTTVAGNVPLSHATRNAIVTLDVLGCADVPVYEGLAAPLLRPLHTAQDIHGNDGLSGAELPPPSRPPDADHAVDVLRRIATEERGQHTLVTLGPLSNIATALLLQPDLLTAFDTTYLMAGGFDGVGNISPVGEFNVWVDPEALQVVLDAPGEKVFIGWDVSRRDAKISMADHEHRAALGPLGAFTAAVCRNGYDAVQRGDRPFYSLPDPIAMAVAVDPTIVTRSAREHVVVGLDEPTRGGTFVDHRYRAAAPNCTVVWDVDPERFKQLLYAACTG
jgi:purine nucleosidase